LTALDAWVLKGRVLRALHRCFLYDSVGFVDQDKVCGLVCTGLFACVLWRL